MTNPLAGGPEDAPRKPDDPQPSPHGRDLTQLPMCGRRRDFTVMPRTERSWLRLRDHRRSGVKTVANQLGGGRIS